MKYIRIIIMCIAIITTLLFGYQTDSVGMPMRDGIKLGTDIYRPFWNNPILKAPALIQRTPYERGWDDTYITLICDIMGYALVVQNLRGYGDSEGEPMVFWTDGWGDLQDGYDAVEWVAGRNWCNGKIGMIGASAHGMTQYYAAGALPPHLVCCAPMVAAPNLYRDCAFTGGEFRKALVETWLQGVDTPWLIDSVCNYPNYCNRWSIVDLSQKYNVAHYPMFHIEGWYDMYTDGVLDAFSELQKRFHNQKLFIGPWGHGDAWGTREQGDLVYPPNAEMDELSFINMLLDWYDYWIKDGGGPVPPPKVKFYLMGDCNTQDTTLWNRWVEADTWPLPQVVYKRYYLRENNLLDTIPPTISKIDTFIYNPANPCTTYGGREFIGLTHGYGPIDQRPIENRSDVLIFSTPPLSSPLTVIGKLKFILYASSDRYDTDWAIRVTDVYPDGRSILVTDNILMARHRHGFDREDSLIPNVCDTFNIDLWSTAQVFNTGHRLRVIISSSNYPRFEKNPNTGAPFQRDDPNFVVATQKVYRTPVYPSHLLLPVFPTQVNIKELARQGLGEEGLFTQSISRSPAFRLKLNGTKNVEISVYNSLGRREWYMKRSFTLGEHPIRLPSLPSGVYFVQARIGEKEKVQKIVVIK
uniref:CocE/NonD family hydrolase n=1 Tax=candidate division WOR-3 bacterium TaxID=2052148 RepID=A0A7C6EK49_UNCW3